MREKFIFTMKEQVNGLPKVFIIPSMPDGEILSHLKTRLRSDVVGFLRMDLLSNVDYDAIIEIEDDSLYVNIEVGYTL